MKTIIAAAGDCAPMHNVTEGTEATAKVWDYMRAAEVATVNLETPLTRSECGFEKATNCKCDPSVAPTLKEAGLDVVTIANNHLYDFYAEGLFDTINTLDETGIANVGCGKNIDDAFEPVYKEINGTKFAFIGMSSCCVAGSAAGKTRPGIAPVRAILRYRIDALTMIEQIGHPPFVETELIQSEADYACSKIREAKANADVVIVHIHWGCAEGWIPRNQSFYCAYQQPLGHQMIDAGADIILGHHSHTLHGIERYNGGVIMYSLGNFLFHEMGADVGVEVDPSFPPYKTDCISTGNSLESVVVEMDYSNAAEPVIRFKPIVMNAGGEPEFVYGELAQKILGRLQQYTRDLGSDIEIDGDTGILC